MSKKNHWNEQTSKDYERFRAEGSSLLTHIYPELKKLNLFHFNDSVLSIGPGGGWLETSLALEYHAKLSIVEPSAHSVETFQHEISNLNLETQVAEIFIDKFENISNDQRFDLILAIHSWHYIGLDITQLKKALTLLSPRGKFCIAQTSEQSFTRKLKELLYPNGHFFIDIEEISRLCEKNNLAHEQIIIPKILPIDRYIKDEQLTDYSKSWLCMIGRKTLDDLPESLLEEAKHIIQSYAKNGTIDDGWGVVIFQN